MIIEVNTEETDSSIDFMHLDVRKRATEILICIDEVYNLAVCKDCEIGVPFESIPAHLKENHGIKVSLEQVRMHLDLENDTMMIDEAEDWIKSMWVGKAVKHISIIEGHKCNECQYSAVQLGVMRNHFSKKHRGFKMSESVEECKIQLVFKGGLQKYIQVEDDKDIEIDCNSESEWETTIAREFEESMANVKVRRVNGHRNLCLMNVFIAKTR